MSKPTDLYQAAAKVIQRPYVPYSLFPVIAAIRSEAGNIYVGVNVENVSFSLTCCAEKNAISTMVTQGDKSISEVLVLVPGPKICPPCGACRQIIYEFAPPSCPVHLCTIDGDNYVATTAEKLLPGAFFECDTIAK